MGGGGGGGGGAQAVYPHYASARYYEWRLHALNLEGREFSFISELTSK